MHTLWLRVYTVTVYIMLCVPGSVAPSSISTQTNLYPFLQGGKVKKKGVLFQTVTSLIDILAGEALSTMKMILIQAPRHFRRQQVM